MGQDEWQRTAELLESCQRENSRNIIRVVTYEEDDDDDDKDTCWLIYIQFDSQRQLFEDHGGLVQIDGTYKTNTSKYSLYTIFVEDNFGKGQPVAQYLIRQETTEWIMAGLEIFGRVSMIRPSHLALIFLLFFLDSKYLNVDENSFFLPH